MSAQRARFGKYSIPLPRSKAVRITLGVALCIGGCLGFLPILGFWMLPLGLYVLAVDYSPARRAARRITVWAGRKIQRLKGHKVRRKKHRRRR